MIAQACDLLLKYVINLLKPKRPQVWRSIKVTNSHFCARVDCMVGARDILVKIGYSESLPTAMQFPDHVKEPDREKLQVIAAELLMAKLEAEGAEGQSLLMTRQFSGGSQASTPSTPTAGSEPSSLSPSHRPSPHEHTHGTLTHTNSAPSSSYQHHQSPFTRVASVSENGGVLGSPVQPLQIAPTIAFVPHPTIASPYEPPTLRYDYIICFSLSLMMNCVLIPTEMLQTHLQLPKPSLVVSRHHLIPRRTQTMVHHHPLTPQTPLVSWTIAQTLRSITRPC